MKILVTGTAGFIGFSLAKKLLERGDEVVGADNLSPYYSVKLKKARNAILQKYDNYHFREIDLADKTKVEQLFSEMSVDKVCHLAAQAGVRYSLERPHAYIDSNIVAFMNVLEGCRHSNIKRLVYASSSSVYGGNTKLPFSEKDFVDTPVSLYAATKKSNELMAHCYSHLYGLQTAGLRFFTVYGPWGRPDMALWLFTEAITNNKPINVFNQGDMERDFTFVDDIVKGVTGAIDSENLDNFEVFNLGNHRSENLLEMIALIEKCVGKKALKNFLPMQPGDVRSTYADIEKAQKKLGYTPSTNIRDGIPLFINWYKEYHCLK